MSQLLNRKADQKLIAQYSDPDAIEREARQWVTQGDPDSYSEQLRDIAATRKGLIAVLNLIGPHRFALFVTIFGALILGGVTGWAIWKPESVTGLAVYGLLAAGALASVTILAGIRRLREIQRLDDLFPSTIEGEDIIEADMTCKTLGEKRGSNGGMFIATAAAIEGALAGFVVSAAFSASVPAIVQLGCAGGCAALLILSTNLLADYFADRIRALRARYRIRRTKRIDFNRHPEKRAELAFLSRILEPLIDDDHTRPTWQEWALAFAALGVVGLLYTMLVILRIWGPSQNGMDPTVVIGFSILCVLIAWIGCVFRGIGPLLPDRQRVATMLRDRFRSPDALVAFKQQEFRAIERWANKVVRAARLAYVQRLDSGDDRWTDPNIQVREPFPHSPVAGPSTQPPADVTGLDVIPVPVEASSPLARIAAPRPRTFQWRNTGWTAS